jgi:hypothetical protein
MSRSGAARNDRRRRRARGAMALPSLRPSGATRLAWSALRAVRLQPYFSLRLGRRRLSHERLTQARSGKTALTARGAK